jgi:hypothetical protein
VHGLCELGEVANRVVHAALVRLGQGVEVCVLVMITARIRSGAGASRDVSVGFAAGSLGIRLGERRRCEKQRGHQSHRCLGELVPPLPTILTYSYFRTGRA